MLNNNKLLCVNFDIIEYKSVLIDRDIALLIISKTMRF